MLDEILAAKMANKELVSVVKTMFNACGTITGRSPEVGRPWLAS